MKDAVLATATSALLVAGGALVMFLLARRGVNVFGDFTLGKRLGTGLVPIMTLGLSVGIVRFIARETVLELKVAYERATILLFVAAVSVSLPVVGLGTMVTRYRPPTGWNSSSPVVIWLYAVAIGGNALVYAYFRGEMHQVAANWSTLVATVVVPLAVLFLVPSSTQGWVLLGVVSVAVIVVSAVQLAFRFFNGRHISTSASQLATAATELLKFSLPRVPAGFAYPLIAACGPLVAQGAGNHVGQSYLLAGASVAQLGGAILQGLSVVLLPRVAELKANNADAAIGSISQRSIVGMMVLSFGASSMLIAYASRVVPVWLGHEFGGATMTIVVSSLAIPAVLLFSVLTSVLDGGTFAPIKTYASFAGLATAALFAYVLRDARPVVLATATVAGLWVAGIWVTRAVVREYGLTLPWGYFMRVILLLCGTTTVTVLVGSQVPSSLPWMSAYLLCSLVVYGGVMIRAALESPVDLGVRRLWLRFGGGMRGR